MCSDGLYKYFPERKLRKYMKRVQKGKSLDECCEQLLEKTLEGEAKDRNSVSIDLLLDIVSFAYSSGTP